MQAPSSTFSSETAEAPARNRIDYKALAWFLLGCALVLAVFDVVVGSLFPVPKRWEDPVGSLNRYFSYYGESIERKLERTTGEAGEESSPIIRAGWLSTELYPPPEKWNSGGKRFVVYGMSFTNRVAEEMANIDPSLAIMSRGGPSAPLSHSFALFEADPYRAQADHVVVGILSSSIPYLQALSAQGFTFESPAPYTFPQFRMVDGQLQRIEPVIQERDTFIELFRSRQPKWFTHLEKLREYDSSWNRFVFDKSILDRSVLAKLVRRAWAKRVITRCQDRVYSPATGYLTNQPVLAAVPELLTRMHDACRKNGQELTVMLLHARGEPGHLDAWLHENLEKQGIHVVSTTDIFSSLDAMNFEGDSHFLPRWDHQIAEAVIAETLKPDSQ